MRGAIFSETPSLRLLPGASFNGRVMGRVLFTTGCADSGRVVVLKLVLSWSKRLECFAKEDPGRARQSS